MKICTRLKRVSSSSDISVQKHDRKISMCRKTTRKVGRNKQERKCAKHNHASQNAYTREATEPTNQRKQKIKSSEKGLVNLAK